MLVVLCDQETCWKPYLTDRHRLEADNHDCDDDDVYNSEDEIEMAICDCLHQYLQHSIDVCARLYSSFLLAYFLCFLASHDPKEMFGCQYCWSSNCILYVFPVSQHWSSYTVKFFANDAFVDFFFWVCISSASSFKLFSRRKLIFLLLANLNKILADELNQPTSLKMQ